MTDSTQQQQPLIRIRPGPLSTEEKLELRAWLKTHGLDSTRYHREFADATQLAKILAKLFPRIVDLPNYPRCSSTAAKLSNWTLLNNKVLTRLQMPVSKLTIDKVAKCVPGVLEPLLHHVMTIEMLTKGEEGETKEVLDIGDDCLILKWKRQDGSGGMVVEYRKYIKLAVHKELKSELKTRRKILRAMQARLAHTKILENQKLARLNELKAHAKKLLENGIRVPNFCARAGGNDIKRPCNGLDFNWKGAYRCK